MYLQLLGDEFYYYGLPNIIEEYESVKLFSKLAFLGNFLFWYYFSYTES